MKDSGAPNSAPTPRQPMSSSLPQMGFFASLPRRLSFSRTRKTSLTNVSGGGVGVGSSNKVNLPPKCPKSPAPLLQPFSTISRSQSFSSNTQSHNRIDKTAPLTKSEAVSLLTSRLRGGNPDANSDTTSDARSVSSSSSGISTNSSTPQCKEAADKVEKIGKIPPTDEPKDNAAEKCNYLSKSAPMFLPSIRFTRSKSCSSFDYHSVVNTLQSRERFSFPSSHCKRRRAKSHDRAKSLAMAMRVVLNEDVCSDLSKGPAGEDFKERESVFEMEGFIPSPPKQVISLPISEIN